MTLKAKFISAVKWTAVGRISTQVLSWAITLLVMRILDPHDYGLVAMAAMFGGLFAVVSEIGLGASVIQSDTVSPHTLRQVYSLVLLVNTLITALLAVVVAPLAARFFNEPQLTLQIAVVALQFMPAAFAAIPSALLDRELAFRGRAIIDFCAQLSGAVLTLSLASNGYGALSLAIGSVTGAVVRAAGLNYLKPYFILPSLKLRGTRQFATFGGIVTLNRLLYYLYAQFDVLVVGKLLGSQQLGVYSVAMNLAAMPSSRIAAILDQVAFPSLAKQHREGGDVARSIKLAVSSISLFAFPVMWGMSSVAPELVNVILGTKWLNAIPALTIVSLAMPLRMLAPVLNAGLQAVGRPVISLFNTCTAASLMLVGFAGGAYFGLVGVSTAWALVFPIAFFVNVARSCPHLGITLREFVVAMVRPFTASVLMFGVVRTIGTILHTAPLPTLFFLSLSGALFYIGATLLYNRQILNHVRSLLRAGN